MMEQTYWSNFFSYVFCWGFCLVFLLPLPRRRTFPLWAAAFLLLNGLLCFCTLRLAPEQSGWFAPVELLASATLMTLACCRVKASIALYFGVWSTLCVALLEELYDLPYLHMVFQVLDGLAYRIVILLAVICIAGVALALTERKWLPVYGNDHVGPRQLTSAVMLYMIFMVLMFVFYSHSELTLGSLLILIGQAYCITLLYLQTALLKKSALQQEVDTLNLLWQQQKRQYEFSKENIARVNQKYHDLKHMLAAVRSMESSERQRSALQEIEDSVHGYDLSVNTNNETLNTVLTEKQLECDRKGITVNCVVDGASVDFMNPVDLYTIMGNAMDNAMEAVSKFEQPHLRIIDVLVHVRQRFLVISVTNPMKEVPSFEDGLPVSTKERDGFHGYGIRSIRSTVAKYGGETVIDTKDNFFYLSITIPLPEETQDA
ncbi:MAG: GHKL domain-containing protein [Clostridiales bacterium]|nr:GHKL domain-containing protein [Clostridiales bacterium]